MTTRETIRAWLREGVEMGATHVVVAHDCLDGRDYPCFVLPQDDPLEEVRKCMESHCRIMEVYAMHLDIEAQLREVRAYHVGPAPKILPFARNLLALLGYQLEKEPS